MLNIKQRQMNLKFLDFYFMEIDGNEGPATKQAYKDFQKAYSLTVDGIYGPNTDSKLIAVVKDIQAKLGTDVDGVSGPDTVQKCKDYQAKNGLAVDGVCGTKTRAKLYAVDWNNIKYFRKEEFTCKCGCGLNNINMNLVQILDEIRAYFNTPVNVSSGCRCTKHNKNVGGDYNSRHIQGKAADIVVPGVAKNKVLTKCKEYVASGRARYTYTNNSNMANAVHIDVL